MVAYDAVKTLWIVTVAILIGAAWFVFFGSNATEAMQVTPNVITTPTTLPCPPGESTLNCSLSGLTGGPISLPGKSAPVTFTCSTAWDRWVEKPGATSDGTTYAALTGASNPVEKWYGNSGAVLTSASAVCQNSEQGRLHLFWTLLAIAVLVAIASEVVRRTIPFEVEPEI